MRWYDPLLYPFALLYGGVTRFRNRMFDIGHKRSTVFTIPTIVVGNLSIGGTGKTPMVEFLIELLKEEYVLATLSRGYGRKSSGFLLANGKLGPKDIGDESFQLYSKFKSEITVAVGEERILAIPQILIHHPETELILLDDAFQHRYLKADFNILLTTYQQPFVGDRLLPLGTLRESRAGAKRADLIIVTKCPFNIIEKEKLNLKSEIKKYTNPDCSIFFAEMKYGTPYPVFGQMVELKKKIILLSGIANNHLLKEQVQKQHELVEVLDFQDHHAYSDSDVDRMKSLLLQHPDAVIMTTEKDAVKLKDIIIGENLEEIPIFALPIKMNLGIKERQFIQNQIEKIVKDKGYIREI